MEQVFNINKYLKYLNESLDNKKYIYHYTDKKNLKAIKKNGLLSLFALYKKYPKNYEESINNYKERVKKVTKKKDPTLEDIDKYFKTKGLSIKSIFFSFYEIIPGLNKERDNFVKNALKIKIDITNLKSQWDYTLVQGGNTKIISLKDILYYTSIDSTNFQKKSGGKYLFTNIPHLSIENNEGVIPKELLII